MADVTYVSRVKLEPAKMDDNRIRRAHLPVEEEPVLFGAHDEIADYYGVSPDEPHAATLDYLVAATGGWLLGTFYGALEARQVSFEKDSLYADVTGEMETENNVLQCKRIGVTFHLTASEEDREAIERVLEVYEDACPVAASVKAAIEIESELDLSTR